MTTYNQDGTPMGGGGSNQLMDLFTVVSNPDAYAAKIKALQDAINEHKKVIEAVGPAKDILELREQTKAARDEAIAKINDAQSKADGIVEQAVVKAADILENAKQDATTLVGEAKAMQEEAKADTATVKKALAEAKKAKAEADAVIADCAARGQVLAAAKAEADALKAEAQAAKDALIAKHKEFLASL